jgi:hypothetical protein
MYGTSGGESPAPAASCVTVQRQGKKRFLTSFAIAATEKHPDDYSGAVTGGQ